VQPSYWLDAPIVGISTEGKRNGKKISASSKRQGWGRQHRYCVDFFDLAPGIDRILDIRLDLAETVEAPQRNAAAGLRSQCGASLTYRACGYDGTPGSLPKRSSGTSSLRNVNPIYRSFDINAKG
jgi:hypothetical protein